MWPYPWTHVGTPSHLGHMDRVAATMPSQAHAGAAQEAPDIGQWEGQDVPLVRPSSCNVQGGIPSSRRYLPTYLGDPVWVIRPRPMGTHRTKTWFTPSEVVRRIGEDTYRIKVGHGQFRERHESQLRVREPDLRGQHVSLSYAAHEADSDDDYAEQEDYTVEKILAQRPKASAPGGLEFKVRWRGYGPSHDTWEPVSSFVPRVNTPLMEYIRKHKTKIHVSDLAALTRAIAARGA